LVVGLENLGGAHIRRKLRVGDTWFKQWRRNTFHDLILARGKRRATRHRSRTASLTDLESLFPGLFVDCVRLPSSPAWFFSQNLRSDIVVRSELEYASKRHNLCQQKKQLNWVQEKEGGESIPSGRLSGGEVRSHCISTLHPNLINLKREILTLIQLATGG